MKYQLITIILIILLQSCGNDSSNAPQVQYNENGVPLDTSMIPHQNIPVPDSVEYTNWYSCRQFDYVTGEDTGIDPLFVDTEDPNEFVDWVFRRDFYFESEVEEHKFFYQCEFLYSE